MHLAFSRLFADLEAESLGHIELEPDNNFGLPEGEYLIHDLYPITPKHGTDLFFTVENPKSGDILLTARLRIDDQDLRVSPEHLQSTQANMAMELLKAVLAQPELQNELSRRLLQVTNWHLAVAREEFGEDPDKLRETVLQELENQFPGSDRSELEALLNKIEDRLGSSSKQSKE